MRFRSPARQRSRSAKELHACLGLADFDLSFDLLAQADMQFAQLLFVHATWRIGQQALGTLRLRESDHISDRLGTGHHRDDAVETESQATVRWYDSTHDSCSLSLIGWIFKSEASHNNTFWS